MNLRFLGFLIFLAPTLATFGQSFDIQKNGVSVIKLDGAWRFHTGDNASFAQPDFDDSSWALLKASQTWSTQGYPAYAGVAWYRFELNFPESVDDPALLLAPFANSDQVYANGRLIGQSGAMPPNAYLMNGPDALLCRIPPGTVVPGQPVHIAIRVWQSRLSAGRGGPNGTSFAGSFGQLKLRYDYEIKQRYWSVSALNIQLLISLLAAMAAFALFVLQPPDREYLWFACFELMSAALAGIEVYIAFHRMPSILYLTLRNSAQTAEWTFFLLLVYALLRQRRDLIFWIAAASAFIQIPIDILIVITESLPGWVTVMGALAWLPFVILVPVQLGRGALRGNRDAALLCIPVGLENLALIALYGLTIAFRGFGYRGIDRFVRVSTWPFPFSVVNITDAIMQLSILAFLVLRFARTRRDEQRLASELEAARTVQQVLVPEEIPSIPGFDIESVYQPMGEVGGDFFQVVALPDGGALLVIGDVSGKGMPAAMTVSLLVGTFRTLAHYTYSPGEILSAMNQRMFGRQNGGFTTCLVVRADSDGTLTLSNAGHLAPYVDGIEVPLENGLPLGLSAQESYSESRLQIGIRAQLTMVTDGVAEARDPSGDLFGFDRTRAISSQPAREIAEAAKAFGQEDDVTVLCLTRDVCMAQGTSLLTT